MSLTFDPSERGYLFEIEIIFPKEGNALSVNGRRTRKRKSNMQKRGGHKK